MIRVFVGTDPRQGAAERVLEHSIRKNASVPVEIVWMRHGDPGFDDWNIGRAPGLPKFCGWGTDFACFRYAIPELCSFQGLAIYLDSDMIVYGDVADLLACSQGPWTCTSQKVTDVSVIDCAQFRGGRWWPSIAEMKPSGWCGPHYRKLLADNAMIYPTLPARWNRRDEIIGGDTSLLHFTDVETQPWRPWPEAVTYRIHPNKQCREAWDVAVREAAEGR